jgi:hypothetical protein
MQKRGGGMRVFWLSAVLTVLGSCTSVAPGGKPEHANVISEVPATGAAEFHGDLVAVRRVDHRGESQVVNFATYGQCQVELSTKEDKATHLYLLEKSNTSRIRACLSAARREHVQVLILPELALAFPEDTRQELLKELQQAALADQMILIAGSYYDSARFSRLVRRRLQNTPIALRSVPCLRSWNETRPNITACGHPIRTDPAHNMC